MDNQNYIGVDGANCSSSAGQTPSRERPSTDSTSASEFQIHPSAAVGRDTLCSTDVIMAEDSLLPGLDNHPNPPEAVRPFANIMDQHPSISDAAVATRIGVFLDRFFS